MEGLGTEEQLMGLSNNDVNYIVKGKRTKRLRFLSPCGVAAVTNTAMTSSCSSDGSFSSTATTYQSADQEEEDMANCLILLAQGGNHHQYDHGEKGSSSSNRRFSEMTTPSTVNTNTKVGFYIYECKTCNRTFPSFQALGGHRASHKKSKLMPDDKKSSSPQPPLPPSSSPPSQTKLFDDEFEETGKPPLMKIGPPISLQLGSQNQNQNQNPNHRVFHGNKTKIHECSICGSEFTSGQALGGHMRRHRASSSSTNNNTESSFNAVATVVTANDQPRNILQLDLNLPAPEDDLREAKFHFPATQKSMVLSAAPALVDCHY